MTTSQRFEDRLLEHLRHVVATRPAPPAPAPARRPQRARLGLAAAGVVAASVAVAVIATSGGVTPSAYAVESQPDGAVSVSIRSLDDADGLQRSLRAAGVPAVVDYVPSGSGGCTAPAPAGPAGGPQGGFMTHTETKGAGGGDLPSLSQSGPAPGHDPSRHQSSRTQIRETEDGVTFTIDPGTLASGEKVYITTSTGSTHSVAIAIGTHKPPAACPPAPAGQPAP
jgi:hypothetical protein